MIKFIHDVFHHFIINTLPTLSNQDCLNIKEGLCNTAGNCPQCICISPKRYGISNRIFKILRF